jgi:hypothetical protein
LTRREIPYRPSFSALLHLESRRPGFFKLADLQQNRPAPNYLLHESAHAVAFRRLFGRTSDVAAAFAADGALIRTMLGESFAMTAEYFAACAVRGQPHAWLFSISSYRHRTPKKAAVGRLLERYGFAFVGRAVLLAFLYNNFLVERLSSVQVKRLADCADPEIARRLSALALRELGKTLSGLMQMSLEFRYDTSRLFLTMFGRSRNIRRELSADPIELLQSEPGLLQSVGRLVSLLGG